MSKAVLDHIIILIPYAQLLSPPSWLLTNFTLTPLGQHADGKTANKLVCFRDGSYIEFIAFIDDDLERRRGHWWDKPFGIVDFALTTPGTTALANHNSLSEAYAAPQAGSRTRDDGVIVSWEVTFPLTSTSTSTHENSNSNSSGVQRGELPFYTHDVTARDLRVRSDEHWVSHPCGAIGVKKLEIVLGEEKMRDWGAVRGVYDRMLGKGRYVGLGEEWVLGKVDERAVGPARLVVRKAAGDAEVERKALEGRKGVLLGGLVIATEGREGGGLVRLDGDGDSFGGIFLGPLGA